MRTCALAIAAYCAIVREKPAAVRRLDALGAFRCLRRGPGQRAQNDEPGQQRETSLQSFEHDALSLFEPNSPSNPQLHDPGKIGRESICHSFERSSRIDLRDWGANVVSDPQCQTAMLSLSPCGRGWRVARLRAASRVKGRWWYASKHHSPVLAELVIGPATSGRTRWLVHPLPQGERGK
jgi:hypothetical protein